MINGHGTQTYRDRDHAAIQLTQLHRSRDSEHDEDDDEEPNEDNEHDEELNEDDRTDEELNGEQRRVTATLKLPPEVELRLEDRLVALDATEEQCAAFWPLLARWMSEGFSGEDRNSAEGKFLTAVVEPFSASQIKKFVECERKWGWQYLEGIKPPTGAAAELGKRVHAVLENWLRGEGSPDPASKEGKIAMVGLEHLPKPSPYLEVERGFLILYKGLFYLGFVDLGLESEDGQVWVIDHKTTGDFMWALTEEEMPEDIQVVLYSKEGADRHDVDEVSLMWLYYRTRGKAKADPRVTHIGREDIESGMEIIRSYTDVMAEHRANETPVLELTPNAYACPNFGGCPFMDRCKLTGKEKRKSIMARDKQKTALSERMQARRKKKGNEEPDTEGSDEGSNVRRLAPKSRGGLRGRNKSKGKEETATAANEGPTEEEPKPRRGPRGRRRKKDKDAKAPEVAAPEEKEEAPEEKEEVPEEKEEPKPRRRLRGRGRKKKEKSKDGGEEKETSTKDKPTPEVNPPEQPSEEEARKLLSKDEEAEEAKPKKPKKSPAKKASGMDDRTAFVTLYCEGIKQGNLEQANKAWETYKIEFGIG